MDYLVSSGGCPVGGNLNNMHIPYSKDNFFPTEEQVREMLGVQDPHLDKRCIQPQGDKMCYVVPEIREPRPQRPKPTPTPPAPKPQEVNLNIQGAPLISHYEKLVDRLEKEIERLTAELERVRVCT